ncbi:lmo0937 family membrane protein [Solitalea longa]|uniref:lmo0937 family membrane protein n=1 Tax=Solitalea longa TaxID=2079460 RepID=UPI000CDD5D87|nr:lmo0937 family membrane protein [Solitalea longa]
MRSLLYIIAVIMVVGWLLGMTVWHAGNIIHILLVIALISFLLTFIKGANREI